VPGIVRDHPAFSIIFRQASKEPKGTTPRRKKLDEFAFQAMSYQDTEMSLNTFGDDHLFDHDIYPDISGRL
jgi:hypothetical protein